MQSVSVFKDKFPFLWRKMDILCHGIAEDDDGILAKLYSNQNPRDTKRTGNAGLQVKLKGVELALNVAVYKGFCKHSPYHFVWHDENLKLMNRSEGILIPVYCPTSPPSWYFTEIGKDKVAGDVLLLEGDFTAIASITKGCIYFNNGKPCKFCALGVEDENSAHVVARKEMLKLALKAAVYDPQIHNIHLTGGNTFEADRGAMSYIDFIKAIREVNPDIPIAVEIPPPEPQVQNEVFQRLKESGADSITINMEFWSDDVRLELMPIKGSIPRSEYLSSFLTALQYFGKNKVSSGFIIGIEPLEMTKNAAKVLTDMNVIVEVYPFKPNDGSIMADKPICSLDEIIEISIFANTLMQTHSIHPENTSGCVKCGACGITQQLAEINNLEGELLCTKK